MTQICIIRAKLIDTSFRNCNVKKTLFRLIEQQNVLFKYSNTREAIFDEEQSQLFIGQLDDKNPSEGTV